VQQAVVLPPFVYYTIGPVGLVGTWHGQCYYLASASSAKQVKRGKFNS
jgi:hypothetical protein